MDMSGRLCGKDKEWLKPRASRGDKLFEKENGQWWPRMGQGTQKAAGS